MFSSLKDHRVTYFGLFAEQGRDDVMKRAALDILSAAVARCTEEDVYSEELEEVLIWVEKRSTRRNPVDRFRDALKVVSPHERKAAMSDAYFRIMRELGLYSGRL